MPNAADAPPKPKAQVGAKPGATTKAGKPGDATSAGGSVEQQTKQPQPTDSGVAPQQSSPSTFSGSSTQQSVQGAEHRGEREHRASGSGSGGNLQADLELTRTCEGLVDTYRRGQVQKGSTIMAIATALGAGSLEGSDNDVVASAFESYCAQVDEITKYRDENRPTDSRTGSQSREDHDAENRGRSETLSKSKGKRRAHRSRSRSRSHASSRSRSMSLASSEDEQPSGKRQKQDPTLFAWASVNTVAESTLRPELQETLKLLRNHEKDLKSAKANLRNSVGVPEFPDAEWINVLLGKPVDLNHVLSGQYTLEQDEKHIEKFGLVELSYRTATPTKVVRNAGDWIIAWQRTTAATLYAFPHRRAELDGYYLHIFSLFSAIHPSHHYRILDYDRRVRKRVAAMRTLLLTDTHEFSDLRDQFINVFGASASFAAEEGPGKKRGGSSRRSRDEEACRRWNRGICDVSDGSCKYIHRCTTCGATDHPATRCAKNAKRRL